MKNYPIADLHCDLLCYLAEGQGRTAFDSEVRCAIPQLIEGNVKLQTMAIFTVTGKDSSQKGIRQADLFKRLPSTYPVFKHLTKPSKLDGQEGIEILLAIENASSFCSEDESLDVGLQRLNSINDPASPLLYISLTWNDENRFGGGALTSAGLKHDGKILLDFLHRRSIALDFSHASDSLVFDALNYIEKNNLDIQVLASHSNFRTVTNVPRNLPDELVKQIYKREGLIGLNFVRHFVGSEDSRHFVNQLEHALALGGENSLCFGADFFYGNDVPEKYRKKPEELFFPEFSEASSYPKLISLWKQSLHLSDQTLHAISSGNIMNFLKNRKALI